MLWKKIMLFQINMPQIEFLYFNTDIYVMLSQTAHVLRITKKDVAVFANYIFLSYEFDIWNVDRWDDVGCVVSFTDTGCGPLKNDLQTEEYVFYWEMFFLEIL